MVFDPFGVAERWIPGPVLHRLIRLGTIAILIAFLIHRIREYGHYLVKPLWGVETLVFVIFIVSYAVRVDPVERSRGIREILIPPVGAVLPFGLLLSMPAVWIYAHPFRLEVLFYFMALSTVLTLWGLWTLRRCFSITVEARQLVTCGPYRWIRHPVYLGEILTAVAVMLWRLSFYSVVIFCLFVVIQFMRARWEEEKLGRAFPGYRAYAAHTCWFIPPEKRLDAFKD